VPLLTAYYLPALLARYRRAFLNIKTWVYEDSGAPIERQLINGELDAALTMTSTLFQRLTLLLESSPGHQFVIVFLEEAIASFEKIGARFALMGRLALVPDKVVRATQDIDFLIHAELADAVDLELTALGYKCLHRSADAANYLRNDSASIFSTRTVGGDSK
jgi:hypothetical protein